MSVLAMTERLSGAPTRGAVSDQPALAAYLRAVVAYIPSEAIALYLFLLGIWVPDSTTPADDVHRVKIGIFVVSLALIWVIGVFSFKRDPADPSNRVILKLGLILIIASISFVAYSMATTGGPWDGKWTGIAVTQLGAGAAAILAFFLPWFVPRLGLEPPAKQDQSIGFRQPADHPLSDDRFELAAAATSELPVSFAASGACSVDGSYVTLRATGTCTVTATQPGNSVFAPATPIERTFRIT